MVRLTFLGGMCEVGRSGLLVETGTERLVLDYGTKVGPPPKFPISVEGKLDAIVLSHAHLDHSGCVPIFYRGRDVCPVYATEVTRPLTELLLLDSIKIAREDAIQLPFTAENVRRTIRGFSPIDYRQPFRLGQTELTFYDAGHIPGSAMVELRYGEKGLLYTGDFNLINTRLLRGADLSLPRVDVLITESTYSLRDHPDRKGQERHLIKIIEDTLAVDGVVLIAAFAVGRAQEIILVLDRYGIDYPLYVDGMVKKVLTILGQHRELLRQPASLDRALEKVTYVRSERMRRRIVRRPGVILTTSGFLSGGPAIFYLKRLYQDRNSSLVLVSWQIEGTPGRTLLETGRYVTPELDLDVKMFVKRLDFSFHVGRSELFKFIERVSPARIFCVHGDHTEEFAIELRQRGFGAVAPTASNRTFTL